MSTINSLHVYIHLISHILCRFTESPDCYAVSRTLTLWTNALKYVSLCIWFINSGTCRMTVGVVNDVAPERDPIKRLLEYIWSHWDDPIDVTIINIINSILFLIIVGDTTTM